MNVLDAIQCPYCEGILFRESYTLRCGRNHRFVASFQVVLPVTARQVEAGPDGDGGAAGSASRGGEPGFGGGTEPRATGCYSLRVIWHADRNEVGRVHAFTVGED